MGEDISEVEGQVLEKMPFAEMTTGGSSVMEK